LEAEEGVGEVKLEDYPGLAVAVGWFVSLILWTENHCESMTSVCLREDV
jgi:hypothetical protein